MVTPAVTAHLPEDLVVTGAAEPAAWLARLAERSTVCTVRDPDALVGFLTLGAGSETELMLGYLFAEHAWGRGYASELVAGLLAHLRAKDWRGKVTGGVVAKNPASAKVLLKSGFERAETDPNGVTFYRIAL
ncbi:Ferrichrome-binding protein [Candidatus Rhodobacter oscarellae]|uniref:Ferrichrome-binding protein n=2 Tax=Candidatus Rhodobacter oscarellae TaxID=1675527 RepID=A0A0J9E0V2_9RHOB|nr:Ferrichrome-binding protein [Candidatus Rhodobacter lobularis]